MKLICAIALLASCLVFSQQEYEPTDDYPFGRPNPEAAEQVKEFGPMIGLSDCESTMRKPDGTWDKTLNMVWKFRYILNGHGVQDETWIEDGKSAGSIRQFIADSNKWYVHYYSNKFPSTTLPAWEGTRADGKIVLYRDQKAPNGMDGKYKITFYDFTDEGYLRP